MIRCLWNGVQGPGPEERRDCRDEEGQDRPHGGRGAHVSSQVGGFHHLKMSEADDDRYNFTKMLSVVP